MANGTAVLTGPNEGSLIEALSQTGTIGSTIRQLATKLGTSSDWIAERLEVLSRDGRVLRIGRGLWIPSEYATLSERKEFVDPEAYTEEFRRSTGITLGEYAGPITFGPNDVLPVHRWWPYVQGFSADFVRFQIAATDLGDRSRVLDPFCGSGTTLVEARKAGFQAIGYDLLAPALLAARVKTRFELSPDELDRGRRKFLQRARRAKPADPPFLRETRRQFTSTGLRRLLQLRAALPGEGIGSSDALRVAFDRILVPSSRLRRSPCLGYRPPNSSKPTDPFEAFDEAVDEMCSDLVGLGRARRTWGPPAEVNLADSRGVSLPKESVDLAITSPPYVNGMDYVMNYKLDLAWLGYVQDYSELARLREQMVACDNLARRAAEPYARIRDAPDPWLRTILEQVRSNVREKGTYRRQDVHAIVHRYFADVLRVLDRVHRALRPGGSFIVVVGDSLLAGTYIPGDLILARLGARVGFRIERVDVARTRRSGQRRSFGLRESVVSLRKPGRIGSSG